MSSLWNVYHSMGSYTPPGASLWVAGIFTNMDLIGPPYDHHRLAYSYDGITWYQNMVTEYQANDICYDGAKFVAVGASPGLPNQVVAYSSDGINWTTVEEHNTRNCIVWTGTRFISAGMGEYGHRERTVSDSLDGITWNVQSVSKIDNPFAIASNINTVVVGGNYYGYGGFNDSLMYSIDGGLHWTGLGASIFTQWCYALATNGSIWVGGGQGANTLAYSYDGINWTGLGKSIFDVWVWAVCWNGIMFVATGSGSVNNIAYSYDGINWTGLGDPLGFNHQSPQHSGQTLVWDGVKFVLGATDFAFPYNSINTLGYSYDGINWVGLGKQFPHWMSMAANKEPCLIPPV